MSRSPKSRNKGSKRIEVQDDLSHNPFAAAFEGLAPKAPEPQNTSAPASEAEPAARAEANAAYRFASKVILRREKKGRAGKVVTRVEGIEANTAELEALARTLGKALGARAFVEEGQILISGDQCQSMAKWLTKAGAAKIVFGN